MRDREKEEEIERQPVALLTKEPLVVVTIVIYGLGLSAWDKPVPIPAVINCDDGETVRACRRGTVIASRPRNMILLYECAL